jgi:hypothetical protein
MTKYTKQEIIEMIREQYEKDLESLIAFLERVLPEEEKEGK